MAQTGIDLNVYDQVSNNPDKKWSIQDLADTTNAEPALLGEYREVFVVSAHEFGLTFHSEIDEMYGIVRHAQGER